MKNRILITGANGFVGQHLIKKLTQLNYQIFSLGRKNVANSHSIILDNFNDYTKIFNIIDNIRPTMIFHLAGIVNNNSLNQSILINTLFPAILLEAVERIKNKVETKILLVGSAAEYGILKPNEINVKEDFIGDPSTYYGITKLSTTKLALNWILNNRHVIIVRPFSIIGPHLPSYMAIGNFIKQVKQNKTKSLEVKMGDLSTSRDFIDVEDFVDIIIQLMANCKANGQIINICSGHPVQIKEIIYYIINNIPKDINVITDKSFKRSNDMPIHFGNNDKLLNLIKNKKLKSWKQSIDDIIKYEL